MSSKEPTPLFRKISDEEVEGFRAKYAGSQADRTAAAAAGASAGAAAGKKKDALANGDVKGGKADKKNAGGDAAAAGKPAKPAEKKKAPAADAPVDISRIDLRVGLIRKAWRHPDAESLYVEEVDVGEEEPRTVVSGLVKYIPEADMQQRRVVLVCNLKPANMRGIKSQAMVLAATSPDGTSVELVEPPEGAAIGERVSVAGFVGEPDEVLNPKKKVWETVQPELESDGERRACWRGVPLATAAGVCTVRSIVGGSIK